MVSDNVILRGDKAGNGGDADLFVSEAENHSEKVVFGSEEDDNWVLTDDDPAGATYVLGGVDIVEKTDHTESEIGDIERQTTDGKTVDLLVEIG